MNKAFTTILHVYLYEKHHPRHRIKSCLSRNIHYFVIKKKKKLLIKQCIELQHCSICNPKCPPIAVGIPYCQLT